MSIQNSKKYNSLAKSLYQDANNNNRYKTISYVPVMHNTAETILRNYTEHIELYSQLTSEQQKEINELIKFYIAINNS